MRMYGFSRGNVNAAYKLLTRNFWKGQAWLMKWVFTAGPIRSFLAPNGAGDFKKGKRFCNDFVGTVRLGGKVMTKFYAFPKVVAAGKYLIAKSYLMQAGCRALGIAYRVRSVYMRIRGWLKKLGISLPIGRASWRASHYNNKIGLTRRCNLRRRRSRRTNRYRRRYVRRYRRYVRHYRRSYRY
jgi:hypothetical protein